MSMLKRLVVLAAASAMVFSASNVSAYDSTYVGGNGYREYRSTPNLVAAGVLVGAAAIAVTAVCLANSNNHHGHCH